MAKKKGKKTTINRFSFVVYFALIFIGIILGYLFSQTRVPDISVEENITIKNAINGKDFKLNQTALAQTVNLDGISGNTEIDFENGQLKINIDLKNLILPEKTILNAYLVDAGLNGGPGRTNSSDLDEKYGTFFNNLSYKRNIDLAPFVQPLGALKKEGEFYTLTFNLPNTNFVSFDSLVVTLESFDSNITENDPRPGPIILNADFSD
ncbi:hypothetical protein KBB41_01190 [Candidatus Curtissbacteria bacterium]|nr:hypothetical protein [Candidatus Curtissbacteria bacterium]